MRNLFHSTCIRSRVLQTLCLTVLVGAPQVLAQTERQHLNGPNKPANAPFSDAVLAGNTLYISGSGGFDSTGKLPENPADEARNLMENFKRTLALAGMTMDDLVAVTVYCPDLALYDTFNAVYRSYFEGPPPSRAFIGSAPLLFGMRFEMQGIAVK